MTPAVQAGSLLTLHLRIVHAASGTVMHSSFEGTPVTLKLGDGELAPALESRLIGMVTGQREVLHFGPGEVFGSYREKLVERVERNHIPADMEIAVDNVYAFTAPDGNRYPGLVRELTEEYALIDFNHPLAGKAVDIEVEIIGII